MLREEFQKKTFSNEEGEANWWDQQHDALVEEFQSAAADGTLGTGTATND
ncbi:MAG: hypothetical protein WA634_06085 [Silvibacterium sp.]